MRGYEYNMYYMHAKKAVIHAMLAVAPLFQEK